MKMIISYFFLLIALVSCSKKSAQSIAIEYNNLYTDTNPQYIIFLLHSFYSEEELYPKLKGKYKFELHFSDSLKLLSVKSDTTITDSVFNLLKNNCFNKLHMNLLPNKKIATDNVFYFTIFNDFKEADCVYFPSRKSIPCIQNK